MPGILQTPLPALNDREGDPVPKSLPKVIDAHVHLFMSGTRDPKVRLQQLNAPFEHIKPVILKHIHQQLTHGVVAIRDGGDYARGRWFQNDL